MISQERHPARAASPKTQGLMVDASEAGLKLMGLLERRLDLPQTLLHRWIRTGQIRLNGSRVQPFVRVATGDSIRIPPFANTLSRQARTAQEKALSRKQAVQSRATRPREALADTRSSPRSPQLEILAEDEDFWAIFKPAGLTTHPGTGHTDSLATRLKRMAQPNAFVPTPVHRLDRDTSGVLLVARTFQALRKAHDALRDRSTRKEYLVWVQGLWPHEDEVLLRHYLAKGLVGGQERMLASTTPGKGQEAVLVARALQRTDQASLLHVRIYTGRTHQIRVQLAAAGHPVLGDAKYGTPSRDGTLYLHALRLMLPDGRTFAALPRWKAPFAVHALPDPIERAASVGSS